MHNLLQIGGITDTMQERLAEAFNIHQLDDFNAAEITHVVTNGHDGVNPDLMASLTNLQVISGYGVGYDAVDATEAARRGIIVTHTPERTN
jgi:lactate dehydrogenase-like 2-hydroxyacid dehydrogenase